ncbi:MAG: hypothetical protein JOY90_34915 [Bradyrhizobium sp.]|nr:hypothetical protein [Bradyrhizobium sp.]
MKQACRVSALQQKHRRFEAISLATNDIVAIGVSLGRLLRKTSVTLSDSNS